MINVKSGGGRVFVATRHTKPAQPQLRPTVAYTADAGPSPLAPGFCVPVVHRRRPVRLPA